MKTYETVAGKVIQLKICPKTAHIKAEFASGGELPECLTGLFTTEREAEIAILKYIDIKDTQEKKKSTKEL
ncbi:MAG: hypothetical protein WC471_06060 [Candidatus Woesearchaeota archaeon]|jgi:hypothetical protein